MHEKELEKNTLQRRILWSVLIINFGFFIIEITTGLISRSMGLVADSLDMLADAFVYSISLMAVGSSLAFKKRTAKIAGVFQFILAIFGFSEVVHRVISPSGVPNFRFMIIVSVFSIMANATCLYLLKKTKSKEVHMKASMIFTSNDVLINIGVIIAGTLVLLTKSAIPDLIIGTLVFLIVIKASVKIYKLGK